MVLSNGSIRIEGFRFARGFIRLSRLVGFVILVVLYGFHGYDHVRLMCYLFVFAVLCMHARARARQCQCVCV